MKVATWVTLSFMQAFHVTLNRFTAQPNWNQQTARQSTAHTLQEVEWGPWGVLQFTQQQQGKFCEWWIQVGLCMSNDTSSTARSKAQLDVSLG